jgi:hypothetical protein
LAAVTAVVDAAMGAVVGAAVDAVVSADRVVVAAGSGAAE